MATYEDLLRMRKGPDVGAALQGVAAAMRGEKPPVEKEDTFSRDLMVKQWELEEAAKVAEQAHKYKLGEKDYSLNPTEATKLMELSRLRESGDLTEDQEMIWQSLGDKYKNISRVQQAPPQVIPRDGVDQQQDPLAEPSFYEEFGGAPSLPPQVSQAPPEVAPQPQAPGIVSGIGGIPEGLVAEPTGKVNPITGKPEIKYVKSAEVTAIEKGQESAVKKKFDKMAESQIAMSSLGPKINYMMGLGARAYRELDREAQKLDIKLDFESGGWEFWKARAVKAGLNINRLTPLMEAVTRLRPEIGFEVMRQIGPFRSAHAGLIFTETLPAFEGHIPSDISKSVSTMTKSFVGALGNKELAMEVFGRELSQEEQIQMGNQYEANFLRSLNKTYRQMGVTTKFYNMGIPIEEVAANSKFTDTEEGLIDYAMEGEPTFEGQPISREEMIVILIDEGKL